MVGVVNFTGADVEVFNRHFRDHRLGFERMYRLLSCYKCGSPLGYFLGTREDNDKALFLELDWCRTFGGAHTPKNGTRINIEECMFYEVEKCLCEAYGSRPAFRIVPTPMAGFAALMNGFPMTKAALLEFDLDGWDLGEKLDNLNTKTDAGIEKET